MEWNGGYRHENELLRINRGRRTWSRQRRNRCAIYKFTIARNHRPCSISIIANPYLKLRSLYSQSFIPRNEPGPHSLQLLPANPYDHNLTKRNATSNHHSTSIYTSPYSPSSKHVQSPSQSKFLPFNFLSHPLLPPRYFSASLNPPLFSPSSFIPFCNCTLLL